LDRLFLVVGAVVLVVLVVLLVVVVVVVVVGDGDGDGDGIVAVVIFGVMERFLPTLYGTKSRSRMDYSSMEQDRDVRSEQNHGLRRMQIRCILTLDVSRQRRKRDRGVRGSSL